MKATLLSIGAIAVLMLGGCSQEAKEDLSTAGSAAGTAVSKTGEAAATDTKKAGEAVVEGAEKTGAAVVAGAQEAGTAVKNAGEAAGDLSLTPKIKTALHAVSGLDVSKVDVDTDGTANTVTLKGSVPDAKQKKQAEDAAKLAAGDKFKVVNNLTVGG